MKLLFIGMGRLLFKPAPEVQVLLQVQKFVLFLNWPDVKMSWQKIWDQVTRLIKLKQPLKRLNNYAAAKRLNREEGYSNDVTLNSLKNTTRLRKA